MIPRCPHAYTEREENYHLDMCRLHPEKLYGVGENDCEWCLYCPDKKWQEWKHSLHPSPEPTAVRPIYGSIERYEYDVESGTISYKVIQTNADRIRSMTDEELAEKFNQVETIGRFNGPMGKAYWQEWLGKEVKDG